MNTHSGDDGRPVRPWEAEEYLRGGSYPATKEELAERVRERGAGEAICALIERLPDREYRSVIDVVEALEPENERFQWEQIRR
jgi:hypothetical protein